MNDDVSSEKEKLLESKLKIVFSENKMKNFRLHLSNNKKNLTIIFYSPGLKICLLFFADIILEAVSDPTHSPTLWTSYLL